MNLPLFALAGCGGGEDFAVDARQSPASVVGAIGALKFDDERLVFSNLSVRTSRPSDNELRFTIPAYATPFKHTGESVIALTLEPIDEGSATRIHASVDVPTVRVMLGRPNMVLSEEKVEGELRKALNGRVDANGVRGLLAALAIASNVEHQAAAIRFKQDPGAFAAAGLFDGEFSDSEGDEGWGASGEDAGWADDPTGDEPTASGDYAEDSGW